VENSPGVSHDNFVPTEAHQIIGEAPLIAPRPRKGEPARSTPDGDPTRSLLFPEGSGDPTGGNPGKGSPPWVTPCPSLLKKKGAQGRLSPWVGGPSPEGGINDAEGGVYPPRGTLHSLFSLIHSSSLNVITTHMCA
jgi:hypothetical protein